MKSLFISVIVALLLPYAAPAVLSAAAIDLGDLVKETQKQDIADGKVRIIWWLPDEYWRAAIGNNPNVPEAIVAGFEKATKDFVIIAIVDGKLTPLGSIVYTKREAIEKDVRVSIGKSRIAPVTDDDQPEDLRNLLGTMMPVLKNSIGKMGENFQFLVFDKHDAAGEPLQIAESLKVVLSGTTYKWRLPLGSLLPKVVCDACSDAYPGNYAFCPYDGTKLHVVAHEDAAPKAVP